MATRPCEGNVVLRRDSEAYERHEAYIHWIIDEAYRQNLLRFVENKQIFKGNFHASFSERDITCDRTRGDDQGCVAKAYFSTAIDVLRREKNNTRNDETEAELIRERRELLYMILGVHFSINEDASDADGTADLPVETYAEVVRDAETQATRTGVPSLLPNLFDAASLGIQVQRYRYDCTDPNVRSYLASLSLVLGRQTNHLHALSTGISRSGDRGLAIECIDSAAHLQAEKPIEICKRNPMLVDTYVEALYFQGCHGELREFCEEFGCEHVASREKTCQYYLRSLHDTSAIEDLYGFMRAHGAQIDAAQQKDRELRKAVGVVCESIGWYLYGLGRNEEGIALLERFTPEEIAEGKRGREGMICVYGALKNNANAE